MRPPIQDQRGRFRPSDPNETPETRAARDRRQNPETAPGTLVRYLDDHGALVPGTPGRVLARGPQPETLLVEFDGVGQLLVTLSEVALPDGVSTHLDAIIPLDGLPEPGPGCPSRDLAENAFTRALIAWGATLDAPERDRLARALAEVAVSALVDDGSDPINGGAA